VTERNKPEPCYRDRDTGVRFIRNGHRHDCAEVECRGCKVCPEKRHCGAKRNCSWHLPEGVLTCGRCLADVRQHLRWIGDLSALIPTQAIADGERSQAANLAGPTADARDWRAYGLAQRHRLTAMLLADRLTEEQATRALENLEPDDEHHPERVTSTWALMIAEDYHHPLPARLTLSWCVAYLDRQLHRIANDEEQDFLLLKAELKKCRQHLEAVLHNDSRRDRGAPCPTCRGAHREDCRNDACRGCLIVRLERHYAHWCEGETCERFHFTDDGSDVWRCPRDVSHWWTQNGYAELLQARRVRVAGGITAV
jgi:hypothetical protein